MDWKIGEIRQIDGEWYQCVPDTTDENCSNCYFQKNCIIITGYCSSTDRSDGKSVVFKKLEKVGEPYKFQKRTIQTYKLYTEPFISVDMDFIWAYLKGSNTIDIIIKQDIEDMEEKKLNLKPFDIEAAKAGKQVCTRDGRKARIICFDAKDTQPIIGLYEKNIDGIVREYLCSYHTDGRMYDDQNTGYDLMMLPEKKEGWVNVYKKSIYKTKEDAFNRRDKENYLMTIKVGWEE